MVRWCLALFLSALSLGLSAQEPRCTAVRDIRTGAPVAGVLAATTAGRLVGRGDAADQLCLPAFLTDTVVVSAPGYRSMRGPAPVLIGGTWLPLEPLEVRLPEVEVRPWPPPDGTAAEGSLARPDSLLRVGFTRSSLRPALVWVPGVQHDERGLGGSTRLSIRGSLLRSPFGVRGVKAYYGPFPLTLADGSTPLELLDPLLVGGLAAVRSTGHPSYGSAPAGLLLAAPPLPADSGIHAQLRLQSGSFGFQRQEVGVQVRTASNAVSGGYVRQRNSGYREQEATRRDQAFVLSEWRGRRTRTTAFVTWQDATWQLPGGLDSLTAATEPQRAQDYAKAIDARVEKEQVFGGVASDVALGTHGFVRSLVQGQAVRKTNPYGSSPAFGGYKRERIDAVAARLALGTRVEREAWTLEAELGAEALLERDQLVEQAFEDAQPADTANDVDTRVNNLNTWASLRMVWRSGTEVVLAAGLERSAYDHHDRLAGTEVTTDRPAEPYPLLALSQPVGEHLRATLRHGRAVSRNTVWELLGTTGAFSTDLAPERVRETELVLEHRGAGGAFAQLAGYLRNTEDLVQPITAADSVNTVFVNRGDADQRGVEAWAGATLLRRPRWRLEGLLTATWQDHVLRDGEGERPVPGIAPWSGGAVLRAFTEGGLLLELGLRGLDAVPASSENDDRVPGYALLHARLSWTRPLAPGLDLEAALVGENLTDAQYTAFVQVNAPGGRYYNPAPARSFFASLALRFGPPPAGE